MALTLADRDVRPLTADEVLRMVAVGILAEDEPVELLHGALTAVSPQSEAHAAVLQRLQRWLAPLVVAGRHDLRVRVPLAVPDPTSLPEPDIAVVERDDTTIAHPVTALLVIEVAVNELLTDTAIKPALYAAVGVPELLVVDVPGRRIRRFTDPRAGWIRGAGDHHPRAAEAAAHGRQTARSRRAPGGPVSRSSVRSAARLGGRSIVAAYDGEAEQAGGGRAPSARGRDRRPGRRRGARRTARAPAVQPQSFVRSPAGAPTSPTSAGCSAAPKASSGPRQAG
jgi:hypothetical protein